MKFVKDLFPYKQSQQKIINILNIILSFLFIFLLFMMKKEELSWIPK